MGQDSPLRTSLRASPARVAGVYLLFSTAWIWLSDRVMMALGLGAVEGFWAAAAKGTAFVVVSAPLLYWLVSREMRALTRALALLRAVTEGTPDAVFVKDRDGKYLLINRAGAEHMGRPVTEVLGRDDGDLFDTTSAAKVRAQDRRVVETGQAATSEEELTAAGVTRTYLANKVPYRDAAGNVAGVIGVSRDITDRKRAEAAHLAHLRFFQGLDRVNQVVQGAEDVERLLSGVLDVVLAELGCDRAWLVHPCDPDAAAWTVPMERTRPEYPGAGVRGLELPVTPETARVFRAALTTDGPVRFGPGTGHPLPADSADQFGIRSQLAMVLRPMTGKPWLFGLHQCSHLRLWTVEDERLFREIGRRLTGALTSLLAHLDLRAGQRLYQQLVATIDGLVWEVDPQTLAFTFVSEQAERLLGYPTEAWTRDPAFWARHIHPDDRDWVLEFCLTATREHRSHDFEYRMLAADGRVVWLRDIVTVVVENGAVTGLRGIMVDVTAQKRAEALQARQNRVLEGVATGVPLADVLAEVVRLVEDELPGTAGSVLLLDSDGARLRHGAAPHLPPEYCAAIDGVVIGPRVGSCGTAAHTRETVLVDDIATNPLWADFKALALAHGLAACWSTPILGNQRGTGPRPVLGTFAVYARAAGPPPPRFAELVARAEHLARVAIESDRADRDLRESEGRYRALVETSADGIFVNRGGRVSFANAAMARMLGAESPERLVGRDPIDLVHPDDQAASRAAAVALRTTGQPFQMAPRRFVRFDGGTLDSELSAAVCEDRGELVFYVTVRDVTARKRAEQALREREGQLRLFVEQGWAAIALLDRDMRYVYASSRWLADYQLGDRDLTGLSHYDLFPELPDRWKEVHRRCLAGAEERCDEDRFERADGTVQWIRWEVRPWRRADGAVVGLITYAEDITARKRLEAHYQQAHKMEAVGRLAGGIAHDFNNLLTVINGFSDMALRAAPADDPHREPLTQIRGAGERAARLTQQLLAYSRKAMIEPTVLDLNELVAESAKLIRLVGEDVLVSQLLAPGAVRIRADRGQIEQVLMNLVVNARDAMPTGGRLTIETRAVALGPGELPDDPDLKPGRYARLVVADTGCGMSDEVRAHLFEPFFTTKGVGKGTGLGLAVVHGAVKQNGGHISVASAVGAGTAFTLLFPTVGAADGPAAAPLAAPARGTETVLLAEDEDAVREITRRSLEGYGYTVLAADGGPGALALADRHPGRIDLLVTDVVMPHLGGRQLAEALRARHPGLRVLFISGYTDDVVLRHGLADTGAFLQKPYTPAVLARKVREMIDRGGAPEGIRTDRPGV